MNDEPYLLQKKQQIFVVPAVLIVQTLQPRIQLHEYLQLQEKYQIAQKEDKSSEREAARARASSITDEKARTGQSVQTIAKRKDKEKSQSVQGINDAAKKKKDDDAAKKSGATRGAGGEFGRNRGGLIKKRKKKK